MKKAFIILAIVSIASIFSGCFSPNPLYGTWSDNRGNQISLLEDGTYNAQVIDSYSNTERYTGTFTVIDNVVVFSKDTGGSINSEWDIRGSILYLTWTDNNGVSVSLELYHTMR